MRRHILLIGPPGTPRSASADLVRLAARLDSIRQGIAAASLADDAGALAPRHALARIGCQPGDALVLVVCRIIADRCPAWPASSLTALGVPDTPATEVIPALGAHPALVQLLCQRSHEALYLAHHGCMTQRPPALRPDASRPCPVFTAIGAVLVAPGSAADPLDEPLRHLCDALTHQPPFAQVLGARLDHGGSALHAAVAHHVATGVTTIILVRCTLLPDGPFDATLAHALAAYRQRYPQHTIVVSAPLGYDRRSVAAIAACVGTTSLAHNAS